MKTNNLVSLVFRHDKNNEIKIEQYTMAEVIFGIKETGESVKDIVKLWNDKGYELVDVYNEVINEQK